MAHYSMPADKVIQTALAHAIDERESFIDSHGALHSGVASDACWQPIVDLARRQMTDYIIMLKVRYGIDYCGVLGELKRRKGGKITIFTGLK